MQWRQATEAKIILEFLQFRVTELMKILMLWEGYPPPPNEHEQLKSYVLGGLETKNALSFENYCFLDW